MFWGMLMNGPDYTFWDTILDGFLKQTDDRIELFTTGSWYAWRKQLETIVDAARKHYRRIELEAWVLENRLHEPETTDGTPLGEVLNDGIKSVMDRLEVKE